MPNSVIARYRGTPNPQPLIDVLHHMQEKATIKSEDILRRTEDIASMVGYWDLTDDIVEGYEKVKSKGETYLPRFVDEGNDEYDTRLKYTKFTNVYRDILEGLASKPFEEEVTLIGDDQRQEIVDFIEDVDGGGNNLTQFASMTFFNGINSAVDWIFIDYPTADPSIRTRADEKERGRRPFWSHVLGRNVLEVRTVNVDGKKVLSYIRVHEPAAGGVPERVRIFQRNDEGIILYQVWERIKGETGELSSKFTVIDSGSITIDAIPMVPFATGRRDGMSWKFFPAMRDAADLQIVLYRNESGLEFVTIMACYPMLAANGLRPQLEADGKTPKKVAVGPNKVLWGLPDGNGNHGEWVYVEPSATSMDFLQKKIDKIKEDLRELGRQPLTATSGNLTVITTAVAAGKARSAVCSWALTLKDTLENALLITAKWMGISGYEPEVNVYTEFDDLTDGGQDLDALNSARERGDISQETYWSELKRRKVLSPEFDADAERMRILAEIPSDTQDDPEPEPGNAS